MYEKRFEVKIIFGTFVAMEIVDDELETYLEYTTDEEIPLLKSIHRETYLKETMPHMASGHYQGRVLSLLSKLVAPTRILEVGTFTGYATLCLAEGLKEGGVLHTIDINEEQQERVQGYFDRSVYADRIKYHIGDAAEIIPKLDGAFDLVFIDADKKRNLYYYELLIEKVPSGGLILIDNVLWKGKIFDTKPDTKTKQIIDLNAKLAQDQRVDKVILPIRDGLFALRKK